MAVMGEEGRRRGERVPSPSPGMKDYAARFLKMEKRSEASPVMNPANPVISRVTSPATSPVRATAKAVMNQSGVILNRLTSSMTGAARSKRMRMRSAPVRTLASPSFWISISYKEASCQRSVNGTANSASLMT